MAYKKDIGDCRESPTFEMMNILKKNSVKFEYYDPYIKKIPKTRNYSFNNKSVELTKKNLDLAMKKWVICTNLAEYFCCLLSNFLAGCVF